MGGETIRALDDISLDITQGEYVAIMGPSGSGKSTMMNIIGCLDISDEGVYTLEGKQIHSLKDSQLAEIRRAIPWLREAAIIANQCPNVYLNMVWAYQISPYMTINSLNEWLDIVPYNKIIGFGGDNVFPENTVGALSLARKCIAEGFFVTIREKFIIYNRIGG